MEEPLEISWVDIQASEELERLIRDRADKMHRYFGRITSARVGIEVPHRNGQGHPLGYHVSIQVGVPGQELVVNQDPGEDQKLTDPYVAVRRAFDAMDKQLESFSQKVRGDVKTHEGAPSGRVVRLFNDYGFVELIDGRELFFGEVAVTGSFAELEVGSPVEVTPADGEGAMGPQATMVRPISELQLVGEIPSRT